MANVALDIRANTAKALGEFKKLSRELDNKFLVQGLKLDVVKNAFRSINREFEQSLGQQGFNTAETTNQLQRNAAANLSILNKLSVDAADEVTKSVRKNLKSLQAEGVLTGNTIKETLSVSGFFDFSGSESQIKQQFESFSTNFAVVAQDLNDAFGESGAGQFQKVITGQSTIDELFNVDFGTGGASKNLILKAIRDNYGNIDALTGEARTRVISQILRDFRDTNTEVGKILAKAVSSADEEDPFRQINKDISGLFSERGLFGILKNVGNQTIQPFGDIKPVPRNLLQLSAKLIKTIFDKDEGLFAILGKSLSEVFGFRPDEIIEPILKGTELLIGVLEVLGEFLGSETFKNFLAVFKPLVEAFNKIEIPESVSIEDIEKGIVNIFGGVREFLGKISKYIEDLDTSSFESIAGKFIGQIVETIPDILKLVFTSITKLIDVLIGTLNSKGVKESDTGGVFKEVLNGITSIIGKTFELVIAAVPKIVSTAIDGVGQASNTSKALVGAIVANFLKKVLTGKSFLESAGDAVKARQARFREGSGANQSNLSAARNSEVSRWNRLYTYLENIIRALNGQAPLSEEEMGRRERGRERRGTRERNKRARELRAQRRRSRSPGRLSGVRSRFAGFTSNVAQSLRPRVGRTQYTNPIGPLPLNSAEDWARRGRLDPMSSRGGTLYSPRLESGAIQQSRLSRVTGGAQRATSRAVRTAGNVGRGALNLGRGTANVVGGAAKGAGRLLSKVPGGGAIAAATGALLLATVFGSGKARADEIDRDKTLTPEEKEFYKNQNEKDTRAEAGAQVVGLAGAGIGGAIGTALGGPVGAIVGSTLGQLVGDLIANVLPKPILEGIGKLAEDIGKWFSELWKKTVSVFSGVVKAVSDFFGPDGGLAKFGNFFYELPGKILDKLGEITTTIFESLKEFASGFVLGILRTVGLGNIADKIEAKEDEESSPNFSGGFQMLGGRTSFNEYEALNMPDGVTFVPLTASNTLDRFTGGGRQTTTNNLQVTVNVNGITEPQAVATAVIEEIERQYQTSLV